MSGMPLPFDAHLLLLVHLPMLPSPCQLWEDKQWGWGGWLGQLGNHPACPWHSSAQDTKSRVNPVLPLQLSSWKEGKGRHTHTQSGYVGVSTLTTLGGFNPETHRKGEAGSYSYLVRRGSLRGKDNGNCDNWISPS